ncbi:MAG: hypothetical protein JEZ07_11950 [Phycisphaerae bacterium]|nr:hypothetical protein [Phycisphaerae bacterium]
MAKMKIKKLWIILSVVLLVLIFSGGLMWHYWRMDASPIVDDYTVEDLYKVPDDCEASFALLEKLSFKSGSRVLYDINTFEKYCSPDGMRWQDEKKYKQDNTLSVAATPELGLSEEDALVFELASLKIQKAPLAYAEHKKFFMKHADRFDQAWENIQKVWDVFLQLNEYEEIADLSGLKIDETRDYLAGMRGIVQLASIHSYYLWSQGNQHEALKIQQICNSVVKKSLPAARVMILRLVLNGMIRETQMMGYYFCNDKECSVDVLQELKENTVSFNENELSIHNSLIAEYLQFKETLEGEGYRKTWEEIGGACKPNSSKRLYRSQIFAEDKDMIRGVWSADWMNCFDVFEADKSHKLSKTYKAYNPVGSRLIYILMPQFDRVGFLFERMDDCNEALRIMTEARLNPDYDIQEALKEMDLEIDYDNKCLKGKESRYDGVTIPFDAEVFGG